MTKYFKTAFTVFLALILIISLTGVFSYFLSRRPGVTVSVTPRSIFIGEPISYVIRFIGGKNAEVIFPDLPETFKDFDIKDINTSEDRSVTKKIVRKTVSMTSFETGVHQVPSLTVKVRTSPGANWKKITTEHFFIKVKTLVKGDLLSEQKIKVVGSMKGGSDEYSAGLGAAYGGKARFIDAPIRFAIKELRGPRRVLSLLDKAVIAGVSFIAGAILLFILYFIVGLILSKPPKPKPKPHQIAIKRLLHLKYSKYLESGDVKKFCSALSISLMDYIQARFNLKKGSLTSREFIEEVERNEELNEEQKKFITDRIRFCDLARFSGRDMDSSALDPKLEKEIKLVEDTIKFDEEFQ